MGNKTGLDSAIASMGFIYNWKIPGSAIIPGAENRFSPTTPGSP